jgi:prolycopene isomerase
MGFSMTGKSVIIIGAGMAGLTAAAYLSRAGFNVRVYEQHSSPGGYISSFTRDGFTFPAGPASFGSNGIIFPILQDLGLQNQCKFIPVSHQMSWDAHDIPLCSPGQVAQDLSRRFPSERRALERYFQWVSVGAEGFHKMAQSGIMFGQAGFSSSVKRMVRHPGLPWAMLVGWGQTNVSLHRRYFYDPFLRKLLDQLGYPVMAGRSTLGMWMNYFYDSWVPACGLQAFANTFVRLTRRQGGEVELGRAVKKIWIENGRARGVWLEDDMQAADWVISAVDLHHTCFDLIGWEELPATMVNKLGKARPSEAVFAVYLGLRSSDKISAALTRFGESRVYFTCADGCSIQLSLLSKDDASLAPDGRHTLFAGMLVSYEDWERLKFDQPAYRTRKASLVEEIITRVEEFIPCLRSYIEVQESASPLTFERYTNNWHGSTAGWNWNPAIAPHFDFGRDLPIKNFRVVGHYTFNPGGVPTAMITAWHIAHEIIKLSKGN